MSRSVLVWAFLVIMLGACGQCGSSSSSAGNQHLVFTGPAAGTLTNATTECRVSASPSELNFLLSGTLGGKELTFNIHIGSYDHGPGTFQVGSLLDGAGELRLQIGSFVGASASGAGTLTINSDGKSGSVDAELSGGEHVKGSFRCDKVATA